MWPSRKLILAVLGSTGFVLSGLAITPVPGEFQARDIWFQRLFPAGTNLAEVSSLKILREDVADGVTRGRSWRGNAYQLGEKTYAHGLAFNASKQLLVKSGQPMRQFTADVGLEDNDDTRRGEAIGQGSVTFHVYLNGKEVFASGVRRRKDPPVRVEVPLGGAREFEVRVGDGGDGRGWDQAVWAGAEILLEDGSTVRLQDMPWEGGISQDRYAFSFRLGDKPSGSLLGSWGPTLRDDSSSADAVERELGFKEPESGLELRVEAKRFEKFPAVEWLARFKNTGGKDTPILEDIRALDCILPVNTAGGVTLHWAKGGVASFDDFAPQTTHLKPGAKFSLQSGEGRSSSQVLPFFNVEGATGGVIVGLGWSGEWGADWELSAQGEVRMKAGLQRTHLLLHPGENIRTPRMLVLAYDGERQRGQNLLRQFLLAHHRPRMNGKPLVAPITCGNWGGTRAEVHLDNIERIIRQDLPLAYYWIDAEWFGTGSWPVSVGDWRVKSALYPDGFKPLSDALRASGRELMLWFEPERVYKGTAWHKEHPDWLLDAGNPNLLFSLGNPEARRFLTDFISGRITEFGLGCYRQDFNMDPLPYWRAADAPDRQGITEIKYIEGLYAFWDELLARHPNLIIDNCASGGRRIDLETVGRATPFWRTDGPRDAIAHQCHSFGLLSWVPLSATSQDRAADDYEFRSSMCSSLCLNWWVSGDVAAERIPPDFPFAWAKQTLQKYVAFRDMYYGDYYPLTSYSQARDVWIAYQLDRPDLGKGMIVALRRPDSPYESVRVPLRGLTEDAAYQFTDLDSGTKAEHRGRDLLKAGLPIHLGARPGSCIQLYQRQ
jgi:alpha-galactosidase